MGNNTQSRPILFSAPMVRAILEGRKTMTRRAVKSAARIFLDDGFTPEFVCDPGNSGLCPYGQVGDKLWVKETFGEHAIEDYGIIYRADDENQPCQKWKPSILMPREASRITLEITGIRVERLHEISESDAIAEGIESFRPVPDDGDPVTMYKTYVGIISLWVKDPVKSFLSLWESINGEESRKSDPWVWVIEFAAKKPRRKMKGWGTALRRQRLYNTGINGLRPLIAFLKDRRKILKRLSENKAVIQKQFPSGEITSSSAESILRYSK